MKKICFLLLCLTFLVPAFGQDSQPKEGYTNYNLQILDPETSWPVGWVRWGGVSADPAKGNYVARIDTILHNGKNVMVIASKEDAPSDDFASVAYRIPAEYEGKRIKLTAQVKYENISDWGGLIMRVDGERNSVSFDNMRNKKLRGTAGWHELSLTLPYPAAKAKNIFVGGIFSGTGTLWLSDLQVKIDGKDITKAPPRIPTKIELDNEFDNGSGMAEIPVDKETVNSLKTLGIVWGYLKYYHPTVGRGETNWDYELFRILPPYLAAQNAAERNNILENWIDGLGKFNTRKRHYPAEKTTLKPDFSWITESGFDAELVSKLERIEDAKRPKSNAYAGPVEVPVPIPVIRSITVSAPFTDFKENPYTGMSYPDAGFRLLALYRYWNIVQYYFPYRELIGRDWKDELERFIPIFLSCRDEREYKLAIAELIASINDGHARIIETSVNNKLWGKNFAAPQLSYVENQAVVVGYHKIKDKEEVEPKLRIGDAVTAVNGKPVKEIIAEQEKYVSGSNWASKMASVTIQSLLRSDDSLLRVDYSRQGVPMSAVLKTYPGSKIDLQSPYRADSLLVFLRPDIALLNADGVSKPADVDRIMTRIRDTKGLIIDLRQYPMGLDRIGDYLLSRKIRYARMTFSKFKSPGYFTDRGFPFKVPKAGKRRRSKNDYKGRVVVLINEYSGSSSEFHAMLFKAIPDVILIGSNTAGADGNVLPGFSLPGGISTTFSGTGVYYPDGSETQRIGIVPDIEVRPTVEGIRQGRDELIEKAIRVVDGKDDI